MPFFGTEFLFCLRAFCFRCRCLIKALRKKSTTDMLKSNRFCQFSNNWQLRVPPLKGSNETDEGKDAKNKHPQTKNPLPQNNVDYKNRHFAQKKDEPLFAMLEHKWIVFFKNQRDNTENRKVRQNRKDLAFIDLLACVRLMFGHDPHFIQVSINPE